MYQGTQLKLKQIAHLVFVTLLIALLHTNANAVEPDSTDIGFTRYVQHYPIGSKTVLVIQSESVIGNSRFGVSADHVEENIEMMNKFIKWAELAQQKGDVLDKEIGIVKGFDFGMYYYWNRYVFETSKSFMGVNYVLCIQPGNKMLGFKFTPKSVDDNTQAGGPIDFKMYFNVDQVKQLIQRMQDFKNGSMVTKKEVEDGYK